MSTRKKYSYILKRAAFLFLSALFLFACLAQSHYLLIPEAFGGLGRYIFRIVFWITLPFRLLVMRVLPPVNHHFLLAHWICVSAGTPLFFYALWLLAKQVLYRHHFPQSSRTEKKAAASIERRRLVSYFAAGCIGIAVISPLIYGSLIEPELLKIRRYEIPINDLPEEWNGLKIIHVSDTHYGPYTSLSYLEKVVKKVNALKGDLVVLTGDYVHRTRRSVEPGIGVLSGLRARYGVLAVLGNHDHWEGTELCRTMFHRIKIPLLDNRHVYLTPEGIRNSPQCDRSICLAGVGDLWEDEVSFKKALEGIPPAMPRIVLSHNPDTAEMIDQTQRVDLLIAGHTHGGQVKLPLYESMFAPTQFGHTYLGGLCEGPECIVLVSRGVGLAGVPVRFFVPPEIAVITLKERK